MQLTAEGNRRSVGVAVEVALALLEPTNGRDAVEGGGRVVLLTTGPPNYGPGALVDANATSEGDFVTERSLSYFRELGARCHALALSVDVYCYGLLAFGVRALRKWCLVPHAVRAV